MWCVSERHFENCACSLAETLISGSLREADATLKDEQTSLNTFDDHMAAVHGSHISVTNKSSGADN